MKPSSKQWWGTVRELLGDDAKACNFPALKTESNEWITSAKGKADEFAKTFAGKSTLAPKEDNRFRRLQPCPELQWILSMPTPEMATKTMEKLDEASGTGPDMLPARILKMCAIQLGKPIALLTMNSCDRHMAKRLESTLDCNALQTSSCFSLKELPGSPFDSANIKGRKKTYKTDG